MAGGSLTELRLAAYVAQATANVSDVAEGVTSEGRGRGVQRAATLTRSMWQTTSFLTVFGTRFALRAPLPPPGPGPGPGLPELTIADRPVLFAGGQRHSHGALFLLMFRRKSARRSPSVRELLRGGRQEVDMDWA